jgi:SNF2 family DNA or RNA helicase
MNVSYSAAHNAVVYRGGDLHNVMNIVPDSHRVSDETVVAPLTLEGQVLAAKSGLPAISPILVDYDWPRSLAIEAPYAHQREMAAFLTLHHRAHNHSEIGTGKTLGVLWAADYLMSRGHVRKVLVVSPLSTLTPVWVSAIGEHLVGRRTCALLHGSPKARAQQAARDVDFYIINNEGLALAGMVDMLKTKDIDLIVVDEAHRYRNATTNRYKALTAMLGTRALWLNTGTPTPNAPSDAYAQQRLIAKPSMSFRAFRDGVMYQYAQNSWRARRGAEEVVARFFTPRIQFLRDECLDLPPSIVVPVRVEPTPEQVRMSTALRRTLKAALGDHEITALNEIGVRNKTLQMLAGAVYDGDHVARAVDATTRIEAMMDIIDGSQRKLLIFAPWSHAVVNIAAALEQAGITHAVVTGDTPIKERTRIFSEFQTADAPRVIVANPGTMAAGLTLTAADTVIWYSPIDSNDIYEQANGRITRPGQVHKTMFYQISASSLEAEIYKRLEEKGTLQGLVMRWIED